MHTVHAWLSDMRSCHGHQVNWHRAEKLSLNNLLASSLTECVIWGHWTGCISVQDIQFHKHKSLPVHFICRSLWQWKIQVSAEVLIHTSSPGRLCHNTAEAMHRAQHMTAFLSSPLGGWFRKLPLSQLSRKRGMIDGALTNSLSKLSIKEAPVAPYIYNQTKRFKRDGWSMKGIEVWMWKAERQLNIELCSHGFHAREDEELFYLTTSGLVEASGALWNRCCGHCSLGLHVFSSSHFFLSKITLNVSILSFHFPFCFAVFLKAFCLLLYTARPGTLKTMKGHICYNGKVLLACVAPCDTFTMVIHLFLVCGSRWD